MFDRINYLFGNIKVEETPQTITITGLPANGLSNDIFNYWRSKKIAEYMFSFRTAYKVAFPKFFAIEMLYMLQELRDSNSTSTPRSTFNKIIKELQANTWLKGINEPHPDILDSSKVNLFVKRPLKHQAEFLQQVNKVLPAYDLRGYVMAFDTGTGKTICGLMTLEALKCDHIVVVSPKRAVRRVWEATFQEEYKKPEPVWVSADKTPLPANPPKNMIYHYEDLEKALADLKSLSGGSKRVGLILDESHAFNEMTSQRTANVLKLVSTIKPIITLWSSATPIKALGSEMIPMLMSFDPFMNADVAERFKKIFGKNATKGADIIKHRMGLISYVVHVQKSKPIEHQIPVKLPNADRFLIDTLRDDMGKFIKERTAFYKANFKKFEAIYNEGITLFKQTSWAQDKDFATYQNYFNTIRRGYIPDQMMELAKFCNDYETRVIAPTLPQKLRAEWKNSRSVIKYVDLKIRGECLGTVVGRRRVEAVLAMIPYSGMEEIISNADKKTVIFTSYVDAVDQAFEYVKGKGFNPLLVYGSNSSQLNGIIKKFFDDPKANPLVTTFQSLSTAVPLTIANVIITLNVPFRDHDYRQAIGRIDRIDQDTQTEVFNLVLDTGSQPNISTRSFDILSWSKEMVESIMGKYEDHLQDISYEAVFESLPSLSIEGVDDVVVALGFEEFHELVTTLAHSTNPLHHAPSSRTLNW